jgi:hypothetical protein
MVPPAWDGTLSATVAMSAGKSPAVESPSSGRKRKEAEGNRAHRVPDTKRAATDPAKRERADKRRESRAAANRPKRTPSISRSANSSAPVGVPAPVGLPDRRAL